MSRVAVWLNNYGNAPYVARCMDSVLAQTYQDYTLYIFDNNSTDGARDIFNQYQRKHPGKIKVMTMPEGLAGIPAMKFGWDYISGVGADYSITLGGHDYWPNPGHLQCLIERADAERKVHEVALVYSDTWQVNADDKIVGRFNNILQQAGNLHRSFIPQWVVSGIDCPPLFGLWNEQVRRQVPVRYTCAGWDHLVVAEAALLGAILYEGRTPLFMRAPPPTDSLEGYGKRHFSPAARQMKDQDFVNQLKWLALMIDKAEGEGPRRVLLQASMFATYLCLRGYNLSVFPGGHEAFMARPEVKQMLGAYAAIGEAFKRLTASHS